jgi:hypothetical protein
MLVFVGTGNLLLLGWSCKAVMTTEAMSMRGTYVGKAAEPLSLPRFRLNSGGPVEQGHCETHSRASLLLV